MKYAAEKYICVPNNNRLETFIILGVVSTSTRRQENHIHLKFI